MARPRVAQSRRWRCAAQEREGENKEDWEKYFRKFQRIKKAGAGKDELNEAFRRFQRKQDKKKQALV